MIHATQSIPRFSWVVRIAIILLGASGPSLSYATIFPVTTTADVGIGTFRWALQQANAPFSGPDTILFTIPGSGPFMIMPLSQLPPLVDPAGVFIDGYSQPGSGSGLNPPSTSLILIVVDGALAGAVHGLVITSSNNTIRGMNIRNFQQDGIRIEATTAGTFNNVIFGNFIGTTHTGVAAMPNGLNMLRPWAGVDILADPLKLGTATNNTVRRNLISGNYAQGVSISSCPPADVSFNHVDSNRIGTDVTGMLALGNRHDGVYIGEAAHDNFIRQNIIAANDTDGVSIVGYVDPFIQWYTHSNHILSNSIGMAADGVTPLPNGRHGVSIGKYGTVWLLGFAPSNDVTMNHIAYNGGHGVMIWEHWFNQTNADKNRVTANSMYSNRRQGIDLNDDGVSVNDPADADAGADQTLNMPVITNATASAGSHTIMGNITIDTNPQQATVEVFLATQIPPGGSQGRTLVGIATPDNAGNWALSGTGTVTSTDTVVATVIDIMGNTSEFSAPFPVNGPVIGGPPLVSFGTVIVGRSVTRTALLRNTGASPLVIGSITCAPADFSILTGPFPVTIPAADSATVLLQYSPTLAGGAAGLCTITSNAANAPVLVVPLSGIGADSAAEITMRIGPAGIDFGSVVVGDSVSRFAVFSNTGNAALTLSSLQLFGTDSLQYTVVSAIPKQVQAGADDSVLVRFRPTATGVKQATLAMGNSDPNLPVARVPLRGTGVAAQPSISVQPASLDFDTVVVGATHDRDVMVINTGTAVLQISSILVGGVDSLSFSITDTCSGTLPSGASDTVRIRFSPTSAGPRTGSLRITSNNVANPLTIIPLRGYGRSGTPRLSIQPASLAYDTLTVGAQRERSAVVSNTGTLVLTITSQQVLGADASDFTITRTCAGTLQPGASDTVRIRFSPWAPGAKAASLRITSNDPQQPTVDVALRGVGVVAQTAHIVVTPVSVAFGRVGPAGSALRTLRVQNTGGAQLVISAQRVTGADSSVFVIAQFSRTPLAAGAIDSIRVLYAPLTLGVHAARLDIASNDAQTPVVAVPLSGVCASSDGAAMQLSRSVIPFGTVPVFTSREETLRVTSTGAVALVLQQQLLHGADASSYSITQAAATPLTTGASSDIRIRLSPLTPGAKNAFFRIISNDAGAPLIDVALSGSTVGVAATGAAPSTPYLEAYPHPVTRHARILLRGYADGGGVELDIHDPLGRRVCVLPMHRTTDDAYATEWDARDTAGRRIAAGIYCCIARGNKGVYRVFVLVR